ncbi:MAG TPA: START domain-containing protein [Puia sp.]|jgi:hypothetical protein
MKTLIVSLFFLPCILSLPVKSDWVFKKEKDGINLYSRHSDLSKFNDVRIEMDLPGTVAQLCAILRDVGKYPEWAYGTRASVLVKRVSANELIYYSEIGAPWPASDRDFYADLKINLSADSSTLHVMSAGMKDYQPEKKNFVRIPMSNGDWNISAKTGKLMHLQYTLQVDPGGSIPSWVLNIFSTKGPLETFGNLKKRLEDLNR